MRWAFRSMGTRLSSSDESPGSGSEHGTPRPPANRLTGPGPDDSSPSHLPSHRPFVATSRSRGGWGKYGAGREGGDKYLLASSTNVLGTASPPLEGRGRGGGEAAVAHGLTPTPIRSPRVEGTHCACGSISPRRHCPACPGNPVVCRTGRVPSRRRRGAAGSPA